jgi:hypothetical protein
VPGEGGWAAVLLAIHAGLALWGAAVNSVTFDENFHVPAGVVEIRRGDFLISAVNPPLAKALLGAAALVAGARLPADSAIASAEQSVVGESFMRRNADRYHRVFLAARLTNVLSTLLGVLVWCFAWRLYGPRGALLALALYSFAPESIAHAGLATLEIAAALGLLASVYACWVFVRRPGVRAWLRLALAVSFTFLTRFSAFSVALALPALAAALARRGRHAGRAWIGLASLVPATVLSLDLGYQGKVSFLPLKDHGFYSVPFRALQREWPDLRLPLPDACMAEAARGHSTTFLFGRIALSRSGTTSRSRSSASGRSVSWPRCWPGRPWGRPRLVRRRAGRGSSWCSGRRSFCSSP